MTVVKQKLKPYKHLQASSQLMKLVSIISPTPPRPPPPSVVSVIYKKITADEDNLALRWKRRVCTKCDEA